MEKDELRAAMRRKLRGFDAVVYRPVGIETDISASIPTGRYTGILTPFEAIGAEPHTVFTFLPFAHEIDVTPLTELFIARGAVVAAPVVRGDSMSFHRIEKADGPFTKGAYGILEPLPDAPLVFPPPAPMEADPAETGNLVRFPILVLVPGLAFTRAGDRLGRGAGYYDRFLRDLLSLYRDRRGEITLAGVCHDFQIVPSIPTEVHDIPVDCLLTEKNAILITEAHNG